MKKENGRNDKTDEYIELIKAYIKDISYGSIVITIQDSQIIQIDKNEKVRIK